MRVTKVIPALRYRHTPTGNTASIHGAMPWYGHGEQHEWVLEKVGWTWQLSDGTIGLGRAPAKTKAEALEVAERVNAR